MAATQVLRTAITESAPFFPLDHDSQVTQTRSNYTMVRMDLDKQLLSSILEQCCPVRRRALLRLQQSLSCWLNVLPVQRDNFNLSAVEFRDSLCLRYMKPLLNLPATCDGCGAPFTTSHAVDCRKGGLIIQRHN